ncbi:MAG: AI-2E family transporter [Acidimicrobiales bacterium]|nr:AI-2E family transporter [Acidimicrobiales bacterium]
MAEPDRVKVPFVVALIGAYGWRIVVGVAALAVFYLGLLQVYVVVVPVVLALFIASTLEPLAARLRGRGLPPAVAALIVFLGALGVFVATVGWIASSVAEQFSDVAQQVEDGTVEIQRYLEDGPLNLSTERVEEIKDGAGELLRGDGAGGGVAAGAIKGARTVTEIFGGIVLMLFTVFFLVKDGERMGGWFLTRIPDAYVEDAQVITRRARFIMQKYLIATALTGLIDALMIGVALAILGVPLVLPLAVLTFMGGFFPIIGATLAGIVAALVALVDGGVTKALIVVAVTIAVQQIEGNVLQPFILERAVKLHALITVWAVAAGLVLGGLLGAFLAVPLVALAVNIGSFYRWRAEGGPPGPDPGEAKPEPASTS